MPDDPKPSKLRAFLYLALLIGGLAALHAVGHRYWDWPVPSMDPPGYKPKEASP